ncbi:hypothetical protein TVAG_265850 [Trichomonas vaginalis G3]|uniref:Uncharacterized protein n=1 Tax=Trichomonas vaginalis (strain ATCC PRA-98 / G3) TaxID=412133 RepID=A2F2I2_TRIV3|nr:hypothetical protein TVAGG3_0980360 [Trichomonas vaginalis G3]EAY00882.1 hypothetical protein TVAG_265850 [Trichomonas vaginalis G3]KAI5489245.1 hypothetical protein TVAGG3_0980360 [Trichomonas vaginalis G3]|eukprot:XP_001313811.1 hypothetical protein [Trichomonas vaginalis G3]
MSTETLNIDELIGEATNLIKDINQTLNKAYKKTAKAIYDAKGFELFLIDTGASSPDDIETLKYEWFNKYSKEEKKEYIDKVKEIPLAQLLS